jgi:hypothetical protein
MSCLKRYKTIFTPASAADRQRAFEDYWVYLLARDGDLDEEMQALEHKSVYYQRLQAQPIRARQALTSAPTMGALADLLATEQHCRADRRLLALTLMYKFASHEAAGIRAAWVATPSWQDCRNLTDRITRYHLCEEFCHLRLFAEMFKVFALGVAWPQFSWPMRTTYAAFARCPNWLLAPIACGSEIMGIIFYRHIWRVLEEVFATEPEALARLHELLGEIMVDELGHIGERRSFLGRPGVTVVRLCLPSMMRRFFADIPEAAGILDVRQMVEEALVFDYSGIETAIAERAWIPAYCRVSD